MASKGPRPACVEDYDEEHHAILPDTRLSANITANSAVKIHSRLERFQEPLIDGASDSGYSSRTAATVNSTQSGPSGGKSPPTPLKLDTPKRTDLTRKSSTRERNDKERSRPSREEKMVGAYPGTAHHAHVPRSLSKPRRRESSHARQYHDSYYDYPTQYHQSAPIDHRQSDYSYYPQPRPPVPEYSSSPHASRYPGGAIENIHVSHPSRPSRSTSYHTYHPDGRPMSFHGVPHGMGSGMASPMYSQHGYEQHGPPPASSAYMHQYSSSQYGGGQHYYAPSASDYPASEYQQERSPSREPPRRRSSSVYTAPQPPMDSGAYSPWYDDEPPMEHYSSRDDRPSRHQEPDEDYYRLPPPGAKPKPRAIPQIHQAKRPERPDPPRKMHTSAGIVPSQRRPSRAMERERDRDRAMERDLDRMDMTELGGALPVIQDRSHRRISRDAPLPERAHSLRDTHRRSTSYQDDRRSAQVAVASSRRRRPTEYYYEDPSSASGDLEDRERDAENYQAARSGRASTAALSPSSDAMLSAKAPPGAGSESGSQKSRSSRGSAAPSRKEDDKNMTLTLNGFQIGFTSEAVAGKSINIRAGETGAVRLNIGGPRPPKQHVNGPSSEYTSGSSRRALEDVARRPRDDRRPERPGRRDRDRDNRSAYGTRYN
ncbi:uncharacterized protein N7479_008018 [Penicillium vulpinum]|uniref:Uncharacterized protein n=1 Tax=Penicillium vulpinum TaxID=29845 RepID=A0A1V6RLN5_9EURO|nr:uncharacterized protein N7479_008018 [Penicillium vulpinum]KAJ5960868.1 hypothetical protein N7479_008018 [Penicillium vulpinum]OQE02715.1 hypothetical protein PENVUL_c039G06015 [Penicillium vulpinum]